MHKHNKSLGDWILDRVSAGMCFFWAIVVIVHVTLGISLWGAGMKAGCIYFVFVALYLIHFMFVSLWGAVEYTDSLSGWLSETGFRLVLLLILGLLWPAAISHIGNLLNIEKLTSLPKMGLWLLLYSGPLAVNLYYCYYWRETIEELEQLFEEVFDLYSQ